MTETTKARMKQMTGAVLRSVKNSLRRRRYRVRHVPRVRRLGEKAARRVVSVQRYMEVTNSEWIEPTDKQLAAMGRLLAAQIKGLRLREMANLQLPSDGCIAVRAGFVRGVYAYACHPLALEPRFCWRFDVLGAA